VGAKKISIIMIPTIQGLLTLRDAGTFPVSQSKLEIALFGAIFHLN
jgi:hypothetical protein